MTQYHIAASGKPARCQAQPGNCPRGGLHFGSKDEADFYLENVAPANPVASQKTEYSTMPLPAHYPGVAEVRSVWHKTADGAKQAGYVYRAEGSELWAPVLRPDYLWEADQRLTETTLPLDEASAQAEQADAEFERVLNDSETVFATDEDDMAATPDSKLVIGLSDAARWGHTSTFFAGGYVHESPAALDQAVETAYQDLLETYQIRGEATDSSASHAGEIRQLLRDEIIALSQEEQRADN
jgi:hypothetical protein